MGRAVTGGKECYKEKWMSRENILRERRKDRDRNESGTK